MGRSPYFWVAIDGAAGSGKSTVARAVAERLSFDYLDTGAMYRAIAWLCLQQDEAPWSEVLPQVMEKIHFSLRGRELYCNDVRLAEDIRTLTVADVASQVARLRDVRKWMRRAQRQIAEQESRYLVMEGRDIGEFVLPEAQVKVFLTAPLAERVRRRMAELSERGIQTKVPEVQEAMQSRDQRDADRTVSPFRPAPGAKVIETMDREVAEIVDEIAALCTCVQGAGP